jgi:hypothetical protein
MAKFLKGWSGRRRAHRVFAVLLSFSVFAALFVDSYVHTVHAFHDHGSHAVAAHDHGTSHHAADSSAHHDEGNHWGEGAADIQGLGDGSADDSDPSNNFADHAHSCLVFVWHSGTELTAPTSARQQYFVREDQIHSRCADTLERPPKHIL